MPIESARVIIEVVAGVLPGTPMPEYTKRWGITSREWYGDRTDERDGALVLAEIERRNALLMERYKLATDYANTILDPRLVNWVRVDWIWL